MAKKNWIYIKRGLSEDAKHRAQMGECIWLYMHIIDRANWDTGIAYDWKDEQEAADMSMPVRTLREQRRKLDEMDYVTCKQRQYGQDIIIKRWINPREYSGKVLNQGDALMEPQGYTQGSTQDVTPTSDSISKINKKEFPKHSPKTTEMWRRMEMMKETITYSIGVTPDLTEKGWAKVVRDLVEFEDKGQKFGVFADWLKAGNEYNRPKPFQIAKEPKLITKNWQQAFMAKASDSTPNYELPDDSKAVPAPFKNPLKAHHYA